MKPGEADDYVRNTFEAAVYVRVSNDERRSGKSLRAQIERVHPYLKAAELQCARTFEDEGVPASTPLHKRPEGAGLLKAIRDVEVRHVVALRLDRLFRSAEEAANIISEWNRHGISLHLIDVGGQFMSTGTTVGGMMFSIISALAEVEYTVRLEQPAALAHRKSRGMVYGPTPYGFERSGSEVSRSLIVRGQTETRGGESGMDLVPEEAERSVLEQMRAARTEGLSLRAIAKLLNDQKVPRKRGGVKWYASTVRNILTSDVGLPEDPEE
jgi:DNA invertase Pin-like site-specific DNA recombinase